MFPRLMKRGEFSTTRGAVLPIGSNEGSASTPEVYLGILYLYIVQSTVHQMQNLSSVVTTLDRFQKVNSIVKMHSREYNFPKIFWGLRPQTPAAARSVR